MDEYDNGQKFGGLEFRDLALFNNALLAKQCWRLMMEPNALWAMVVKGIYFHNKDFHEVGKRENNFLRLD